MWRFHIDHEDEPAPGVRRLSGPALRKSKPMSFYLTISPAFVALSVEANSEGRKLIVHFTRLLGQSTLRYRDKRGEYEDFTAEWHLIETQEAVAQRILNHLALGFSPQEMP